MTVTFETAKRLEGAGFPQPRTVQSGSVWFSGRNKFYIGEQQRELSPEKWFSSYPRFAPTATDILEQLPGWNLAYIRVFGWIVYCGAPGLPEPIQFRHSNPAEAAALAWFHEHEKKNESRT